MSEENNKSKKFNIIKKVISIIVAILGVYWLLTVTTPLHLSTVVFFGVPFITLGWLVFLFLCYLADKKY